MPRKDKREYSIWKAMRNRCNNKNCSSYPNYGGRGINVCKRWDDFNLFYSDMGISPHGFTIERINNNDNYNPSNCKWASRKEQANNKRNNRIIVINGISKTLTEWAEYANIGIGAIKWRLKHGFPAEDLIKPKHQIIRYRGEKINTAKLNESDIKVIHRSSASNPQLAKEYNVTRHTIRNIRAGKTWKHLFVKFAKQA